VEDVGYYTFPTEEELDVCKAKGITLVGREEMVESLVECFGGKDSGLRGVVEKAAVEFYASFRGEREF
jgi:hypothetical protein